MDIIVSSFSICERSGVDCTELLSYLYESLFSILAFCVEWITLGNGDVASDINSCVFLTFMKSE
jgi:hypothetical protein